MARTDCRTVLVVAHSVISVRRLLDAVRLVEADPRVQVAFTVAPDATGAGMEELLAAGGGPVLPWVSATQMRFDLALAAKFGAVHEVRAPLMVMPHEASLNLMVGGAARTAGGGVVYGLDPHRLVRDRRSSPRAILLSHEAEVVRLARVRPEIGRLARVAGDSSYDRLAASLPLRDFYRRALGVAPGQKLVVVASTAFERSVAVRSSAVRAPLMPPHEILHRTAAELPANEFRVLALFHPDIEPGRRQMDMRMLLRYGLSLMPPDADWRAPLVAADWVISDYGPVAPYCAVSGAPVLLFGAPDDEIDPDSGLAELARMARRLTAHCSIRMQLRKARKRTGPDHYQDVVARITSEPGRCNRIVRRLMYRMLGLRQPHTIPTTDPVSPPFLIE